MEWFYNTLGAVLGTSLGLLVSSAAGFAGYLLLAVARDVALALPKALERYATRKEVVIEEYDMETRMTTVFYSYPKPSRVRLAREGKAGERPDRRESQKKAA